MKELRHAKKVRWLSGADLERMVAQENVEQPRDLAIANDPKARGAPRAAALAPLLYAWRPQGACLEVTPGRPSEPRAGNEASTL
jgi:hypothetical protein